MPSPNAASSPATPSAEEILLRFDRAWQGGAVPRLSDYVRLLTPAGKVALEELIKIDLECRWRLAGQANLAAPGSVPARPRLEDYLRFHPELGPLNGLSPNLVAYEYEVRHSWGDRPGHGEYTTRFLSLAVELPEVLRQVDLRLAAESTGAPAKPPAAPVPDLAQPAGTPAELLQALRQYALVSRQQLAALDRELRGRPPEPHALARELIRRGWLTPYQANQWLRGRAADLVLGPHLLLERLGEGGAGQVFKARHRKMDRVVALKVLRKELVADAEVMARFYREVQLVSQVSHPNIVHAYDAGPVGAAHVLVMEYIEGTDLGRLVRQGGTLPVGEACAYIRQAALGLHHAHEKGLVHRDVKPANLMLAQAHGLQSAGFVKVLDLGLGRLHRPGDPLAGRGAGEGTMTSLLTPMGSVLMGTPDYMAPEQAIDFHAADARADVYGLGCSLYHLLTGRAPFAGGSAFQKLMRHQQAEPPPLEAGRADAPPGLSAVLRKMMAKRPEDRYQTAAEVVAALAPFAGPGVEAGPTPEAIPWHRPSRRWVAAAVLLLAGVTLFASFGPWRARSNRSPRPVDSTVTVPQKIKNSIGMELALIPAGRFWMGSLPNEELYSPPQGPLHEVAITKPFYMGVYEVTHEEYKTVTGKGPSGGPPPPAEPRLPVTYVSWEDAVAFCKRLSDLPGEKRAGRSYRLPTEAEWEYACRAGTTSAYSFGDDPKELPKYGYFKGNTKHPDLPQAVGRLKPNPWGLYDMHGNVWEWCFDYAGDDYYARSPKEDPRGPNSAMYHVARGGAFYEIAGMCRSGFRNAGQMNFHVGFRVVCNVPAR